MKKFFFLLTILFSVSVINAQIIRNAGIKTGVTFLSQDWKVPVDKFSTDKVANFNIGIFAELFGSSNFSLVTELNYVRNKIKSTIPVRNYQDFNSRKNFTTMDGTLDYLNISALCKFRIDLMLFSPYLIVGPKLDIELDKSFSSIDNLYTNMVKSIDSKRYGIKAGIGSQFNLLALNMLVEVIYDINFNKLLDKNKTEIKANAIDLRLGIIF